jgi:predicted RNase H-like nuclease
MRLVKQLGEAGFVHDLDLAQARHRRGRWLLEVYPHPAMVRLFGLTRIIQYKKGSVTKRRTALQELQRLVGTLRRAQPRLEDTKELHDFLTRDLESLRGQSLKQYEDSLDALFCAYLAYHCWCWGSERNEMIGDLDTGYIVVPT